MDNRTEQFLNDVTMGVRDDPELRLDIRAELASHLEDKAEALQASGVDAEASRRQAVAALGDVAVVSAELASGNRSRLRRRAWIRRLLRFALVPAAVVLAVLCSDLRFGLMLGQTDPGAVGLGVGTPVGALLAWAQCRARPPAPVLQLSPRDLWASDPDIPAYYANFVTHEVSAQLNTEELRREEALEALAAAAEVDPDNARYDYLRAAVCLRDAVEIRWEPVGEGETTWTVHDSECLARAMEHLEAALREDLFRRYDLVILSEKLAAYGEPRRLLAQVQQIGIAAAMLLPDLAHMRQLGRACILHADALIETGRADEAIPFLEGWRTLALHLNGDAWTLIDCLVVTAMVSDLSERAALLYERLGRPADAERTRRSGDLLAAPGQAWRERRKAARGGDGTASDHTLRLYGGVLAATLLPALGELPPKEDYEAGRRLEYVVLMEQLLTLVAAVLLGCMLLCLAVALRWRFSRRGAAIPILLVPGRGTFARILGFGVVLPVLVYAAVVMMVPISGQAYAVEPGGHKLLAEAVLLVTALVVLPAWLTVRYARRRCLEIGIATTGGYGYLALLPVAAAALCALAGWCVPARVGFLRMLPIAASATVGITLLLTVAATFVWALVGWRGTGLYIGSAARTLIPVFAAAVVVLCVVGRPWLLGTERHLLANDRLIGNFEVVDPQTHVGGFSRVETDIVHRLRTAVQDAAAATR